MQLQQARSMATLLREVCIQGRLCPLIMRDVYLSRAGLYSPSLVTSDLPCRRDAKILLDNLKLIGYHVGVRVVVGRGLAPQIAGRLYVWKTSKTDIKNEAGEHIENKGPLERFSSGEAENILKQSHLVKFTDDTMSLAKCPRKKRKNFEKWSSKEALKYSGIRRAFILDSPRACNSCRLRPQSNSLPGSIVISMKGSTASTLRIDHKDMCVNGRFPLITMPPRRGDSQYGPHCRWAVARAQQRDIHHIPIRERLQVDELVPRISATFGSGGWGNESERER